MQQLQLPFKLSEEQLHHLPYRERVQKLLESDLAFHGRNSNYATHGWHAFPAKFPPQLPCKFITELTQPDDVVLDPMMGSCTTLIEAVLLGRKAIGCDIDPLSLQIGLAKLDSVDISQAYTLGEQIVKKAQQTLLFSRDMLQQELETRFNKATKTFIDYWFRVETQLELLALIRQIEQIEFESLRNFFTLVFSAIIITKSGGVSLATDLAHTRPHKAKDKTPNSALAEFRKRLQGNLKNINYHPNGAFTLCASDARRLPLRKNSIDLIVTSPPYANNAIDYMRAHKFSLVWLGHDIATLSKLRRQYVGGDTTANFHFLSLPEYCQQIVHKIDSLDHKKGSILHRYYTEMTETLSEMLRVLRPGKAAIVVVGTSTLRGIDTQTHTCLVEIGQNIGFELEGIGVRQLDRDKRMMPARWNKQKDTQIESRMHEEYVIAFLKPKEEETWQNGLKMKNSGLTCIRTCFLKQGCRHRK
jgi:DNA modification methylase